MSEALIPQPAPQPATETQPPAALVIPARSPSVTYTLIALNVLVFLAMLLGGVSLVNPSVGSVLPWGADYAPLTLHGQWWRVVTSVFVHFGIIHIGMNMYVLYQIGPFTERLFGHARYLLLYMLAGIGGSLVSLYIHPNSVGAGASGAIFGVYGGLLAFMFVHRSVIPAQSRTQILRSAAIFLGYNFIFGLASTIDLSAHIAGLVVGFGAGLVLVGRRDRTAVTQDAVQ